MIEWSGLPQPWRVALSAAWEAYGAGSTPVGAAVVDPAGRVVASARNRVYEPSAPVGQVSGSHVAHAEINALATLDPERRYEDHVLYSTLEPCPMCLGATVVASVGTISYAGVDPYAGSANHRHLTHNALTARVRLNVRGPLGGPPGALASALHAAYYLRRKPEGHVVRAYAKQRPDLLALAESLLAAGARQAAVAGMTLESFLAQSSL